MRSGIIFCLLPLLLNAAKPDVYVWQRKHTPELESGIIEFQKSGGGKFYFLAGELENDRTISVPYPPFHFMSAKRITPVIRIHIKHLKSTPEKLAAKVLKLYAPWQKCSSLQIDLDAPESKIDYYTSLMKELREQLPDVELSATVLPCHLRHREKFRKLAGACDFYVLQIHGLEKRNGEFSLINKKTALEAISRAVNLKRKFKIAIPVYSHNINGITVKPDLELVRNICRFANRNNIGIIIFRLWSRGDGETLFVAALLDICRDTRNYPAMIDHRWDKSSDGAWHLYIRNFGYFSETISLDLQWAPGFIITDADTFNGAEFSFDRKKLTLTLPPDQEEKVFLWLRTPAPFDKANSPLTITGKDTHAK
ncbi:MAG: DUF3142 domain-containing protein [Lentisphaerae bacterium]|nr:DUF3142 domain-containing protein [Lentisphaerota bacterium]